MRSIEQAHGCWCSLRMASAGSKGLSGLRIIASAILPLVGGFTEGLCVVEAQFPSKTQTDLYASMFELLVSLDYEVGARYKQHELLPKAERTDPPPT